MPAPTIFGHLLSRELEGALLIFAFINPFTM